MKALVIYDSLYGNTATIAHAISDGLAAALGTAGSVDRCPVGDAETARLHEWDLLLVGGPTHGSNPSPPMHEFLRAIPPRTLTGLQVGAFDTRADMASLKGGQRLFGKFLDRLGYAAPKIADSLNDRGGKVLVVPEGFIVEDKEGPLRAGELERATDWGRQVAASYQPS